MARHSLFPNSVTIHYTTNGHPHLMVLPTGVVAGSAPNWTLPVRTGSPVVWTTAVDELVAVLQPNINTADSIDYAELFTYEATGAPAEFLAAYTIDAGGTESAAAVDFGQAVFPFKAVGGLSLRLTLMEGVIPVDQHVPYSGLGTVGLTDLVDFILSDDDWVKTRGDAFPIVTLGMTSKINDKLRKRLLLDA